MASGNRYADCPPFDPGPDGTAPFAGLRPRSVTPARPVLEHTLTSTDRLDLLALHYYNDPQLWWRILDANPEILCGADIALADRVGSVILIPAAEDAEGEP